MATQVPEFCLDTSFLINGWHKTYRRTVFPSLWERLDKLIHANRVCSCMEVYNDLMRQADDLSDWAKRRKPAFPEATPETIKHVLRIAKQFPQIAAIKEGKTSYSDAWVIAHALTIGAIVVTDEMPAPLQRASKPPKIPDLCDHLAVKWASPIVFLEKAGISL